MDGATLAEAMRQRGINMRYLGKVLDLVLRSPARDQLDHIYVSGAWAGGSCWLQLEVWTCPRLGSLTPQKIGIGELITRSAKHIFKTYLQVLPLFPSWWDLPGWHGPRRRALGGGLGPS